MTLSAKVIFMACLKGSAWVRFAPLRGRGKV
jgi:hypothetical protein